MAASIGPSMGKRPRRVSAIRHQPVASVILNLIATNSPLSSILQLCVANQQYAMMCRSDTFWKLLFERDFIPLSYTRLGIDESYQSAYQRVLPLHRKFERNLKSLALILLQELTKPFRNDGVRVLPHDDFPVKFISVVANRDSARPQEFMIVLDASPIDLPDINPWTGYVIPIQMWVRLRIPINNQDDTYRVLTTGLTLSRVMLPVHEPGAPALPLPEWQDFDLGRIRGSRHEYPLEVAADNRQLLLTLQTLLRRCTSFTDLVTPVVRSNISEHGLVLPVPTRI